VLHKSAEGYLLATPPNLQKGLPLAYIALGVDSTAVNDTNKGTTEEWENQASIKDRIEKANTLIKQKTSIASYWTTPSATKVYQCASCHSGTNSSVHAASYKKFEFRPLFAVSRQNSMHLLK
jgi:hypothetical protein